MGRSRLHFPPPGLDFSIRVMQHEQRMESAWARLFIAGAFEVAFALSLKQSDGFSRLLPSLAAVLASLASLYFLSVALVQLPVGTAYAVWTGIGALGSSVFGILLFDEPRDASRIGSLALVVIGILGLRLTASK